MKLTQILKVLAQQLELDTCSTVSVELMCFPEPRFRPGPSVCAGTSKHVVLGAFYLVQGLGSNKLA